MKIDTTRGDLCLELLQIEGSLNRKGSDLFLEWSEGNEILFTRYELL